MEDADVDQLADHERDDRASNRPQALSEDACEGGLHVGYAARGVDRDPPGRRRKSDRHVGEQERVADQPHGDEGNQPHAAPTEVLVDDVGHDEDDGPQQHARREAQRSRLAEQVPAEGRLPQRRLQREDLDADELGDDRVGGEERCQPDEQARRARDQREAHLGRLAATLGFIPGP
jgi:hypothetical protein